MPLILAALLPAVAEARAAKMVVVVANRLTFADLDNPALPTISRIVRDGAVGLVSPNCVGPKSEASVILTAQMGISSRANGWMRECYDVDEIVPGDQRAGDAYLARTGRRANEGGAVFLGIGQALRETASLRQSQFVGGIGEALNKAGKRACTIGNADIPPESTNRMAAALAADSTGRIDFGWLSAPGYSTVHDSEGRPYEERGFFSDTGRLQEMVLTCLREADLVVVDFGDTTRLDDHKLGLTDAAYAKHKAAVLSDLDQMIERLISSAEFRGASLALISFSPPVDGSWDQMTPVVVYPASRPGLLISATTRTKGVIAASDFAPTVLDAMGLEQVVPMTGRETSVVAASGKTAWLNEIDTRVSTNRRLLTPVMWVIAVYSAVFILGSAVILAFSLPAPRPVLVVLRGGMLVCASFALAMLLAPMAPAGPAGYVSAFVGFTLLISLGGYIGGSALNSRTSGKAPLRAAGIWLIYAATVAAIVVDAFQGGKLCRFALPSSFYISGLRYYGIGNEYAALLIFMGGLAVLFSPANARRWMAPLLGAIAAVALGIGSYGANCGGTAAAVVTFATLTVAVRKGVLRPAHALCALVAGLAAVVLFAELDWRIVGATGSHAGRLAGSADGVVYSLAWRKVLMNLRLTFSGNAWRLYAMFTPLLVMWFWGIQRKVRAMFGGDRAMMPGFRALWTGGVAAYIGNDSGIVMICIMMAMTVVILVYSLLEERLRVGESSGA